MSENSERLVTALRKHLEGEVTTSSETLEKFSHDESIFSILPTCVVCPKHEVDVQATVNLAREYRVPITARGGGTGVAGQSIGAGIILDFKKYMNRILDVSDEHVWVEPGVVLSDLQKELSKHGKMFALDPSSGAHCTLGGMVATNASGPLGFRFGSMRKHVENLQLVLADGSIAKSNELEKRFPQLVAQMRSQRAETALRKNSSGYDLTNMTSLLVGSEGTLALSTRMQIKILQKLGPNRTEVFAFETLHQALDYANELRDRRPLAIELVDHHILTALKTVDEKTIDDAGLKNAQASLWVKFEAAVESPSPLWSLRSQASKVLHDQPGPRRPLRCIEDGVVPIANLTAYGDDLRELLKKHDCDGAIFGHAGDGHLHVNPQIDVTKNGWQDGMYALMDDAYQLIEKYNGSISGEHGDGLLRKRFVPQQWKELYPVFQKIKKTFDPYGIFNPDKKI